MKGFACWDHLVFVVVLPIKALFVLCTVAHQDHADISYWYEWQRLMDVDSLFFKCYLPLERHLVGKLLYGSVKACVVHCLARVVHVLMSCVKLDSSVTGFFVAISSYRGRFAMYCVLNVFKGRTVRTSRVVHKLQKKQKKLYCCFTFL